MQYDGYVCGMDFAGFVEKTLQPFLLSGFFGWQSKKGLDKVFPVQGLALGKGDGEGHESNERPQTQKHFEKETTETNKKHQQTRALPKGKRALPKGKRALSKGKRALSKGKRALPKGKNKSVSRGQHQFKP